MSQHYRKRLPAALTVGLAVTSLSLFQSSPAWPNNYGESAGWQFETSADQANHAVVLDLLEKRKAGGYQAPNYTTSIERQYNCSVSAVSTGNDDAQTAVAQSPTLTGPTASSTGNGAETVLNGQSRAGGRASTVQSNSGSVTSGATGSVSAHVQGHAHQTLNSAQTNSGSQHATVSGSSGCILGGVQ